MMSNYEIVRRPAQRYAAIAITVPMEQLGAAVPPLNGEVNGWLAKQGVASVGPEFWKYDVINMSGRLSLHVGVGIDGPAQSDERVEIGELPAGSYLETTYHGHPDGLMQATADLLAHAESQGLSFDRTDEPDGEHWAARLQYYLERPGRRARHEPMGHAALVQARRVAGSPTPAVPERLDRVPAWA